MTKKKQNFWSKKQSKGLVLLFTLVLLLQLIWFFRNHIKNNDDPLVLNSEWLAMQHSIDSLKVLQSQKRDTIYAFNPNYINDYRGLQLGFSTTTLDKIYKYRASGKFMNSIEAFQEVTQLPDSVIQRIAPYLKFPEFKHQAFVNTNNIKQKQKEPYKFDILDINQATIEDFKKIRGVGDGLSQRIIAHRDKLGVLVHLDQIDDIWGLSPEVIQSLKTYFIIQEQPVISKWNINTLSAKDLSKFPYFDFQLAKDIVTYRTMNQGIKSSEDLTKIKGFPIEKLEIIALYLEF